MVESAELERECEAFCLYLCGERPGAYVLGKYVAAHALGVVELPSTTRFEREVVRMSCDNPGLTQALDSHARVFGSGSLLRRKLVLLLALLETKSPPAESIDAPVAGSRAGMLAQMAWLAFMFAFNVVVSSIVLIPVRIRCAKEGPP